MNDLKYEALRNAYGEILVELGKTNKDIVVLDADLSGSTKTNGFSKAFPERFFNMGVAEQNMSGVAGGMAAAGKKVFASSFAMFAIGRGWEPFRQNICLSERDVKIVATHTGLTVGEDGATHQIIEDIGLTRVIPKLTVIVPTDANETRSVMKFLANDHDGPAYVRLSREKFPVLLDDDYEFELGKFPELRQGADLTLVACGIMVGIAMEAADKLAKQGIDCAVLSASSIKPFDHETLKKYAGNSKAVVSLEEHNIIGGLGAAVAESLTEHCPKHLLRIGVDDRFGESGPGFELMSYFGLDTEKVTDKISGFYKNL